MDGYGLNDNNDYNAVKKANKPNLDKIFEKYPSSTLIASGKEVGLPKGIMGNSEVGHLNIGAGRIVYQMNTLIDKNIEEGVFYKNEELNKAIEHAQENNSKLHLFGLVSDGNVHSNLNHLYAIFELAKRKKFNNLYLHAFMDGRDTSPSAGIRYIQEVGDKLKETGVGKIASVSGRYYAMDRDQRWDRIEKAYNAICRGKAPSFSDPKSAIQASYDEDISDEFIIPRIITDKDGKPTATINNDDSILFFNFRADRARQITQTFIYKDFDKFKTDKIENLRYTTFTEYDKNFNDFVHVAFRKEKMKNILGEYLADNKMKQLRLAETEKYAHVTFFFNGGIEKPFDFEDRILVSSPKVASYDLQPEMSAYEVRDKAIEQISKNKYNFIAINFANCDMVGHTGDFDATIKAVETVDKCVGELFELATENDYDILLTADHGNAEKMISETGEIFTAHTTNLVPFLIALANKKDKYCVKEGKLSDIAPTVLNLLDLEQPKEMTGKNLIEYLK